MKSYKKIIKVDLVNQLFICNSLVFKKDSAKYYIEFKDLENKESLLDCIKNYNKHYIEITSDSFEDIYKSRVKIVKCSDVYKKKNKAPKPSQEIINLCIKYKIKLNYNVEKWINKQNDLKILDKFISRKAIIDLSEEYSKGSRGALLLSSRLTALANKQPNLKIKIDNMVALYDIDILKKCGII